ncbi:hypothetical protein P9162_29165, partial [Klebsiella pneumoniae]|uniref:hypothetical protein n=1 Tax=Klebsiella pneumoniae TaxID=573 RepID=UPI002D1EBB17
FAITAGCQDLFFTTSGFFFGFCIIPPSQTPDGTEMFSGTRRRWTSASASVVLAGFGAQP